MCILSECHSQPLIKKIRVMLMIMIINTYE
nr:MAG TPA: hypothetical protein [Caudoviricetes sp.]